MSEKKESELIIKNSILSVGIKGFDYLLSFITIPILLECLGEYKYGVYASTLSIISWVYYFDLGIGNGMRNKVTEACTNNDYDSAQKNISIAYFWVSLISLFIIIATFYVYKSVNLSLALNAYVPNENLNLIMYLAIIIASINFVFQLSSTVLLAIKKTALNNAFGIASKFILLVVLIGFRYFKIERLIYVVVAEGLAQLTKNIIATIYLYIRDKRLVFSMKKLELSYSKGIFGFGILIFVMQLSSLVLNSTDNILIQKLFSSAEVTPYSLCYKYFSIINAFFSAAITPLWASYTSAYVQKNVGFIKSTLKKSWLLYAFTLFGIIVAIPVFMPFMKLYLRKELVFSPLLPILMALYFSILIFSHTFSTFVHAISKVKLTTIVCVISATLNIPLSIFFAIKANMGVSGIILGSIVCVGLCLLAYMFVTIKELRQLENEKK